MSDTKKIEDLKVDMQNLKINIIRVINDFREKYPELDLDIEIVKTEFLLIGECSLFTYNPILKIKLCNEKL